MGRGPLTVEARGPPPAGRSSSFPLLALSQPRGKVRRRVSAYSRAAHALTHEVADLKGVPLTGQLAQSAAVPPVHVAQLAWQLSHARTCAGYLRVSPHISLHLPARLGRIERETLGPAR